MYIVLPLWLFILCFFFSFVIFFGERVDKLNSIPNSSAQRAKYQSDKMEIINVCFLKIQNSKIPKYKNPTSRKFQIQKFQIPHHAKIQDPKIQNSKNIKIQHRENSKSKNSKFHIIPRSKIPKSKIPKYKDPTSRIQTPRSKMSKSPQGLQWSGTKGLHW